MQAKTNILGIDLSHYNTVTDWNQVKVDFIYLKATESTDFVDPKFLEYAKAAKQKGILTGAYHFARLGDPVAEAKHFLSVIGQVPLELIPCLDLEVEGNVNYAQWIQDFQRTINRPMELYTGEWFIDEVDLSGLTDIPLWVSYYKDTPPPNDGGWTRWIEWQYSETGQIPGIQGNVDLDYASSLSDILDYQPCNLIRTVIAEELNVRSEPWVPSDVLYILTKGQQIHLSKLRGDWAFTTFGDKGGWVNRHYLA